MRVELGQFIAQTRFCRVSVEQVADKLPADDTELDLLIEEAVREHDQAVFLPVVIAATSRQRLLDARHLEWGAMLIPYPSLLGSIALRMQGDVPANLLRSIVHFSQRTDNEAAALLLSAVWCQEHRNGVFPEQLIPEARRLARQEELNARQKTCLIGIAARTGDAALSSILRQNHAAATEEEWRKLQIKGQEFADDYIAVCRKPILDLLLDKPSDELACGRTLRRAVPRVGRNQPCPCGSGKKYKHCCHGKDQERLHHSSDIAGLTAEELNAEPEPHLTSARMDHTYPHEVVRFDPTKIPRPLLQKYFVRLACFKLVDRAAEAFEKLGFSMDLEEAWDYVMFSTTQLGRKDIAERLLKVRAHDDFKEEQLELGTRLLLADGNAATCLDLMNAAALKSLQTDDIEEWLGFAYGVAISKFSPLGIFIYRSMIPLVPSDRAAQCFEQILEARDRLKLSPDDPFSDVIDKRLYERNKEDGKEATALRQAQRNLEAKGEEVRDLKETVAQMQREIGRRENTPAPAAMPAVSMIAADEHALRQMHESMENLRSLLKERHSERNELRRKLQKAHADLETLRQNAAASSPAQNAHQADNEDDLLLPQGLDGNQPVRIIEFPRGFHSRLAQFPRHVARGAMTMLGRLAAGEEAAFSGAVRLKACPSILRHRIGIDFRLLFRLLPNTINVVDLITRQDLERKIKTLI